jgi:hypothetical protein
LHAAAAAAAAAVVVVVAAAKPVLIATADAFEPAWAVAPWTAQKVEKPAQTTVAVAVTVIRFDVGDWIAPGKMATAA